MTASRPILGLLASVSLLVLVAQSLSFVPLGTSRSVSQTVQEGAFRGSRTVQQGSEPQNKGSVLAALAPAGVALLGLAALGRQQRTSVIPRQFFSSGSPPPAPVNPTSYKDFSDPWLGSADLGFDPLKFAVGNVFDKGDAVVPETTYYNYRESEVKHGRFAMAAFLAIFFEEADRGAVLNQLGIAGASDNLDGTLGLDEVQAPVLALGLGAQALAEYSKQSKEDDGSFLSVEYNRERCPGDLGFDPLSIGAGNTRQQLVELHNGEVNLGRLAMIGVTAFLAREFVIKDL